MTGLIDEGSNDVSEIDDVMEMVWDGRMDLMSNGIQYGWVVFGRERGEFLVDISLLEYCCELLVAKHKSPLMMLPLSSPEFY